MKPPSLTVWEFVLIFLWWNWPWLVVALFILILIVVSLRRIDKVPLPFDKNAKKEEPQYRDFG